MGRPQKTLNIKVDGSKWGQLLNQEQDRLGCLARAECVESIFGSYFEQRKGEPAAMTDNPPPPQSTPSATPPAASSPSSSDAFALARQLGEMTARATGAEAAAQRWEKEATAAQTEAEQYRTMAKHAPVDQILAHLSECPNCKPELERFVNGQIAALPPERVKELARQQKWWPPPPIEFTTRKARP